MSAAVQRTSSAPVAPLISIGQVLSRLEAEFPELSPSKLRFLEERGLVHPARTPSGYRMFSLHDIERITLVLLMQRDHYLPLKVIRRYLADLDAGRDPAWPGTPAEPSSMLPSERRLDRADLLEDTGASATLLDDAVATGLLPASDVYGDREAAVLRSLVDLESAGIEPRHLRSTRLAVEREVELIANALLPLRRRPDAASRHRADERAEELAGRLDIVRAGLVRVALAKHTTTNPERGLIL